MHSRHARAIAAALLGASSWVALACALEGDVPKDPYAGSFDQSLPDDVPAQDLNPEEQTALCESLSGYTNGRVDRGEVEDAGCAFLGWAESRGSVARCEDWVDSCVPDLGEFSCAEVSFAECSSTVAELEACVEEQVEHLERLANASCEELVEGDASEAIYVPACAGLAPGCPVESDLFVLEE